MWPVAGRRRSGYEGVDLSGGSQHLTLLLDGRLLLFVRSMNRQDPLGRVSRIKIDLNRVRRSLI